MTPEAYISEVRGYLKAQLEGAYNEDWMDTEVFEAATLTSQGHGMTVEEAGDLWLAGLMAWEREKPEDIDRYYQLLRASRKTENGADPQARPATT